METEPQPEGIAKRPDYVKGPAAAIWDQHAPDLIAKRALTPWDARLFARWCILEAAFEAKPEHFTVAMMTETRRIADCFGLSGQQSRARIKQGGQPAADPAEKYFGKHQA